MSIGITNANILTPDQALKRLENLKTDVINTRGEAKPYTHDMTIENIFVFSNGEGFILLPNTDSAPPLLGYSTSGSFSIKDNPALSEWMAFYNEELERLEAYPAERRPSAATGAQTDRKSISPLIKTEWNQEAPYNELCPKVDGHETVTGCVATAMAQVLKFYNYPEAGVGTHSYFWKPGEEELSFDYASHPFAWDLMTDRYDKNSTDAQRKAVAELMLACGVSVDMHYEPGESGAATISMGTSLVDIFKYSRSTWMANRSFYGLDEWEKMIYDELEAGRPVLYSGAGTAGGHQFICDGYDGAGYFHFNWGWGGMSNGYFLLTALNPADLGVGGGAGGFNTAQVATLGLKPDAEGKDSRTWLMYNTTAFRPYESTVKAGDAFHCSGEYFNYSLASLPEGATLGMKFRPSAGDAALYVEGPGVGGMKIYEGRTDDNIKFPSLQDGTYFVTPALHADGVWSDVRMPVGFPGEVRIIVTDGVGTVEMEEYAQVEVTDVTLPSVIYKEHDFPMTFKVVNPGEEEYYGNVTPCLLDSDGTIIAESQFRPVDVLGGEEAVVGDYIANFKAVKDETLADGTYYLVFRDDLNVFDSNPIEVNVATVSGATEIKISDFRLVGESPVSDPAKVEFEFTVSCEEGVYYDAPRIDIFPGDGGYDIYSSSADRVYLTKGETAEVKVKADLSALKDGSYLAVVYNGDKEMTSALGFSIDRSAGVIEITGADSSEQIIYDLKGVRHESASEKGIYIVNGKKIVIK
ncbi:MAG: C10 family peptidase [Muribaculaceae bacterium]|nr:C10 family peptidase [Muribaculaceae bacterium]